MEDRKDPWPHDATACQLAYPGRDRVHLHHATHVAVEEVHAHGMHTQVLMPPSTHRVESTDLKLKGEVAEFAKTKVDRKAAATRQASRLVCSWIFLKGKEGHHRKHGEALSNPANDREELLAATAGEVRTKPIEKP